MIKHRNVKALQEFHSYLKGIFGYSKMAITLKYSKKQTKYKEPIVSIKIKDRYGKLIDFDALIDSGADTSVIPKYLAKALGVEESEAEEMTKVLGGKMRFRRTTIDIAIDDTQDKQTLKIPAIVLQDDTFDVPFLLGRKGFFDNFHITFRQNEEEIQLSKVIQQ